VNEIRSVTVYCGSSPGADPAYAEVTRTLARMLARDGIRVVYGGGKLGLMGILADTAMEAGGEVIGVMPQALIDHEIGHPGLSELRVVASMHERKAMMAELADAFIALPGGIGTLEELIEVYTWSQLGLHRKPIGALDVKGFYGPLAMLLDSAVEQRFLREKHREILIFDPDPETLLTRLAAAEAPSLTKWIDADQS
jgi:uncharacterized protein (TIGR00730 family)